MLHPGIIVASTLCLVLWPGGATIISSVPPLRVGSPPASLTGAGFDASAIISVQEDSNDSDNAVSGGTTNTPASSKLCKDGSDTIQSFSEEYPLTVNNTYMIISIPKRTTYAINITHINQETMSFLIAQAHSQSKYLILANDREPEVNYYVNSTNPGIVVSSSDLIFHWLWHCVFITNCHEENVTTLFMVRNYTAAEPVPGGYAANGDTEIPQPYLHMMPNILTTEVMYRASAFPSPSSVSLDRDLKYETFLSYMYERDISEKSYWDILITTSTVEGLRSNARLVSESENNNTAEQLSKWFVSYSGVGAVIGVIVSYNNSGGALYSSAVSYGCDFIDAEEFRCTKLVNPLAKLFCASLLFIGGLLLFVGHRWLNFTMFISGFLFFWCTFFLLCAQDHNSNIDALGWGTLVGAVAGGVLWLVGWHKFQRPFHSALLLLIMNVIFVGMVVTHFLRYAIVPRTATLPAFVVFPVLFAIVIIAYSVVDIKRVHIFSCAFLGSYGFIVPCAFYFGSSLTYIVINVIGIMTVSHYSDALGYPPFQVCDIILLCLWIILFISGMAYQLHREKSGPPFHPPNLASWHATKKACNFVLDKSLACLPMDPDPGGVGIEDQTTWMLRLRYCLRLLRLRLACRKNDISESGYESFQRVRVQTQTADDEPELESESSRLSVIKERVNEWIERLRLRFRKDEELLPSGEDVEEEAEDEEQLQDVAASCCTFRKSRVVLDDAYEDESQEH